MKRKQLFLFATALSLLWVSAFPATLTEAINKEFPFAQGRKLTIDNINGKIAVEQWDKNIVKIEAVKTAKGSSDESLKKALSDAKVDFVTNEDGITVTVKDSHGFSFFSWLFGMGASVEVSFKVTAPPSSKLSLCSVNGGISVMVKDADVTAETVNGTVFVNDASLLSASTVNGAIDFDVENISQVESVNGAITGTVRAENPKSAVIEVVNGSIVLKMASSGSFSVSAETVNGGIDSDFPEIEGTKREKSGDVNGGGDKISLETVNGSIEVRKK